MTECYYFPRPGTFYPEDPPRKEQVTVQRWSSSTVGDVPASG
jgi:hypothetical protein